MLHNQLLQLSLLVGALLPHAIAVLNQAHWSSKVKSLVAFGACLVAAVVVTAANGDLNLHNWYASAAAIFTMAQVTYYGLWKPTGATDVVEQITSVPPPT